MPLAARDRRLARVTAATVLGRWDALAELRRTAPSGEPDRAWREALLQTHLFAGFPRLVEAYAVLDAAGGLGALDAGEARAEPDQPERGFELFRRIYGSAAVGLREKLAGQHPDFGAWIQGHAYGRVLARPGLAADRREILACVALAALGQERQLASHLRGALACGARRAELVEALAAAADLLGEGERTRAQAELARLPA